MGPQPSMSTCIPSVCSVLCLEKHYRGSFKIRSDPPQASQKEKGTPRGFCAICFMLWMPTSWVFPGHVANILNGTQGPVLDGDAQDALSPSEA